MNIDKLRQLCLSFPGATEKITWGADLTFRVYEKIFAVTVLEPAPVWLSFKCSPENFAELTERPGVIPAPYLARAQWVALETKEALPDHELTQLLREAYDLIVAKLPKRARQAVVEGCRFARRVSAKRVRRSKRKSRKTRKKTL